MLISQAVRTKGSLGKRLPDVWDELKRVDVHFHRGSLVLIAAAPGVGKSAFAMNYALALSSLEKPVETLYISMDTSRGDQGLRIAQNRLNKTRHECEALFNQNSKIVWKAIKAVTHIEWQFDSGVGTYEIGLMVRAYQEQYGDFPELIIIDNLANIAWDGDEFRERRRIVNELEVMAKKTGACVMALEHVSGPYKDGTNAVPASGVMAKINELPSVILTLSRQPDSSDDTMLVSVVKNRNGRSEPSGRPVARLHMDLEKMRIGPFNNDTVFRTRTLEVLL